MTRLTHLYVLIVGLVASCLCDDAKKFRLTIPTKDVLTAYHLPYRGGIPWDGPTAYLSSTGCLTTGKTDPMTIFAFRDVRKNDIRLTDSLGLAMGLTTMLPFRDYYDNFHGGFPYFSEYRQTRGIVKGLSKGPDEDLVFENPRFKTGKVAFGVPSSGPCRWVGVATDESILGINNAKRIVLHIEDVEDGAVA